MWWRHDVYYLPMHVVHKTTSTTTKLRVIFDASERSSTCILLNDKLLVGPVVHTPLIDVLLQFCQHRVALMMCMSRIFLAAFLHEAQCDLHHFIGEGASRMNLRTTDWRGSRSVYRPCHLHWVWRQGQTPYKAKRHTHEQPSQSRNPFTWTTDSLMLTQSWKPLPFREETVAAFEQRKVPSQEMEIEWAWSSPSSSWAFGRASDN